MHTSASPAEQAPGYVVEISFVLSGKHRPAAIVPERGRGHARNALANHAARS
jgi:hypothetical protein